MGPVNVEYHPFYCEENVYRLCAGRPGLHAVFIAALGEAVAMWQQRVAQPRGGPVFWDYHVVAVDRPAREVWDLDTTLGTPCSTTTWLGGSFRMSDRVPPMYRPVFRVVGAEALQETFSSDRRHMVKPDGGWRKPPPPWPAPTLPGEESNLARFVDMTDTKWVGEVMDLPRFARWCKH